MSAKTKPNPFRADHVGSYLRPAKLQDARAKNREGQLSAEALREIEDEHITALIRKQEAVGLRL
jgi:5-methyltetrahydropteroyltriglutamate--homocysteine methyltransferase